MSTGTHLSGPASASAEEPHAELRARIDALNHRAYELRGTDPRSGLVLAEEVLESARRAGYRAGEGYALRARGACRTMLFELDSAFEDLRTSLELFDELRDDRGRGCALQRIGDVHWRRGEYPAALASLTSALDLHHAVGNRAQEAETLNSLGSVQDAMGAYARALEAYNASLAICEEAGDRVGRAHVLNNLGNIHGRLGEYAKALQYHEAALVLKRELGDRSGMAIACANLGASRDRMGDHAGARKLFEGALGLARDAGERKCEAGVLANMGDVYRALGDASLALEHYRASLEVSRVHGLHFDEAHALLCIGETLVRERRPAEALEHLGHALEMQEEVGSMDQKFRVHEALSAANEGLGDTAAALRHFKEFHRVKEGVWSTESDRRIQSILVQAEVERTQRESEILREKNEELDRLSREDALTGLSNRRHVDEHLALEWERARRFGRDLSVVLADVDHFKSVNDRFSHAIGDEVLRAVGRILRESTRQLDVVGRWGGEEFVLILVETSPDRAARFCEKLRAKIEAYDWPSIHPELSVTISMGVAGNAGVASPEALLGAADARLYQAKREGRNRVQG